MAVFFFFGRPHEVLVQADGPAPAPLPHGRSHLWGRVNQEGTVGMGPALTTGLQTGTAFFSLGEQTPEGKSGT